MARFEAADNRIFKDVFVCRKCNATNKGNSGKHPQKCRKCGSKNFRAKNKVNKRKA